MSVESVDDLGKATRSYRRARQELLTLRPELFAPGGVNLYLSEIPENLESTAGILNLSTFDLLAQILLCCSWRGGEREKGSLVRLADLAAVLAFTQ